MKQKSTVLLSLSIAVAVLFVVALISVGAEANSILAERNLGRFSVGINAETEYQYLNVTGGTYAIENVECNFTGKIDVRNDATLLIRNATLNLTTRGETYYRDGIMLFDKSRLIVENATVILQSIYPMEESHITVRNEASVNITDSQLRGNTFVIGEESSQIFINRSSLQGPKPTDFESSGVITQDNSIAKIQNSVLDIVSANDNSSVYIVDSDVQGWGVSGGGNALIKIDNSYVRTAQWFSRNCTLLISNSTAEVVSFGGSVLRIEGSRVKYDVSAHANSTAWLIGSSVNRVSASGKSQVWLINSAIGEINAFDQGKVYVGWQLPLLGAFSFPHTWLPYLQGLGFLLVVGLAITLLVFLNRRWKQWQLRKQKQALESESIS